MLLNYRRYSIREPRHHILLLAFPSYVNTRCESAPSLHVRSMFFRSALARVILSQGIQFGVISSKTYINWRNTELHCTHFRPSIPALGRDIRLLSLPCNGRAAHKPTRQPQHLPLLYLSVAFLIRSVHVFRGSTPPFMEWKSNFRAYLYVFPFQINAWILHSE